MVITDFSGFSPLKLCLQVHLKCVLNIGHLTLWLEIIQSPLMAGILYIWAPLSAGLSSCYTAYKAAHGPLGDGEGDLSTLLPSPPVHPDSSVKNVKQQPSLVQKPKSLLSATAGEKALSFLPHFLSNTDAERGKKGLVCYCNPVELFNIRPFCGSYRGLVCYPDAAFYTCSGWWCR